MIIDDEADNASINTKKNPDEATRINKQIREMLNLFDRRCYVGYTATPFANIFINPENEDDVIGEDLFPGDFSIIALVARSNYVGAQKIFLDENSNILREIDDNEICLPVKHKKESIVECLPESLYSAIYLFLLSGAVKRLRGIKNSIIRCLSNVFFRIHIQEQIKKILLVDDVQSILRFIKYSYKKNLNAILQNDTLAEIYRLWEGEYASQDSFTFQGLEEIVNYERLTKVLVINSKNEP